MQENYEELLSLIKSAKNIGIITHKIPDADAVGSSCGLAYALRELGKTVEVLFEKPLKQEYDIFELEDIMTTCPTFEYDLFISTDCGATDRFGIHEELYLNHKNTVNIDHHITNPKFADLNFVDAQRASASEYIFHILSELKLPIPLKSQRLIYTGIIRDCGAFMYDNTSAETHRIVAKLMDNGVDFAQLNEHFMQTTPYKTIILQKHALNSMEFFLDGKIVFMNISNRILRQENCTLEDTSSIVSQGIEIEGVELAIMCTESIHNLHKVSFRSRKNVDCSKIAMAFGGGGHTRASGCQLRGTFDRIKRQLINESITVMSGETK